MAKIATLSADIVAKIAAGEVIERPIYAVKELVENSLDAGATSIVIEILQSGLSSIRVMDNGEGMDLDDLQKCFAPHATSKIFALEDLSSMHTLGFRGEALSSISAVSSTLILRSRLHTETTGWELQTKVGKLVTQKPIGMPVGTDITVVGLFRNVPARKKFLKSERIEFHRIVECITHFAFLYPKVQFVLKHNGKTILDLLKTTDITERIRTLLGNDVFVNLIPVNFSESLYSLQGFIVKPQITTSTPHKQFMSINTRGIFEKNISVILKKAYGTLLEKNQHPICVLFLTLPTAMVDVNVHPRKEEVRFFNLQQMQDFIARGLTAALENFSLTYTPLWNESEKSITQSYAGLLLKEKQMPWNLSTEQIQPQRQILQIDNLYLFVPTASGFLLIDQHAAHERILYEQFFSAFQTEQKKQEIETFSKPFVIELGITDGQLLAQTIPVFSELGFSIEPFQGQSFLLTSVPKLFSDRDYRLLIRELLEDIKFDKTKSVDALSQKMIAFLACRGAVKAGDMLSNKQRLELFEKLKTTPHSSTCPHGRPTHIRFDKNSLAVLFKRK